MHARSPTIARVSHECDAPTRRAPPLEGLPPQSTLHVVWVAPFDNGDALVGYNLTITDDASGNVESVAVPHLADTAVYEYTKTGLCTHWRAGTLDQRSPHGHRGAITLDQRCPLSGPLCEAHCPRHAATTTVRARV